MDMVSIVCERVESWVDNTTCRRPGSAQSYRSRIQKLMLKVMNETDLIQVTRDSDGFKSWSLSRPVTLMWKEPHCISTSLSLAPDLSLHPVSRFVQKGGQSAA